MTGKRVLVTIGRQVGDVNVNILSKNKNKNETIY